MISPLPHPLSCQGRVWTAHGTRRCGKRSRIPPQRTKWLAVGRRTGATARAGSARALGRTAHTWRDRILVVSGPPSPSNIAVEVSWQAVTRNPEPLEWRRLPEEQARQHRRQVGPHRRKAYLRVSATRWGSRAERATRARTRMVAYAPAIHWTDPASQAPDRRALFADGLKFLQTVTRLSIIHSNHRKAQAIWQPAQARLKLLQWPVVAAVT